MRVDVVIRLNILKSSLAIMAGHVLAHRHIQQKQHTSKSKGGDAACTPLGYVVSQHVQGWQGLIWHLLHEYMLLWQKEEEKKEKERKDCAF